MLFLFFLVVLVVPVVVMIFKGGSGVDGIGVALFDIALLTPAVANKFGF